MREREREKSADCGKQEAAAAAAAGGSSWQQQGGSRAAAAASSSSSSSSSSGSSRGSHSRRGTARTRPRRRWPHTGSTATGRSRSRRAQAHLKLFILFLVSRLALLLHLAISTHALGVVVLQEFVKLAHLLLDVLLPGGQVHLLLLAALHPCSELLLFAVELLLHLLHLLFLLQEQCRLRSRRQVILRRCGDEAATRQGGHGSASERSRQAGRKERRECQPTTARRPLGWEASHVKRWGASWGGAGVARHGATEFKAIAACWLESWRLRLPACRALSTSPYYRHAQPTLRAQHILLSLDTSGPLCRLHRSVLSLTDRVTAT